MLGRVIGKMFALALLTFASGCEQLFGVAAANPQRVVDLAASSESPGSLTLRWTAVRSGGRAAPRFFVQVAKDENFVWEPLPAGLEVVDAAEAGAPVEIVIQSLDRGQRYYAQVATFRVDETGSPELGPPSASVSEEVAAEVPSIVFDADTTEVTDTRVSLVWTEVDDGTGSPANYFVGIGAAGQPWAAMAPGAVLVRGSGIGGRRSATRLGLSATTAYSVLVASSRATDTTIGEGLTISAPLNFTTRSVAPPQPFFSDNFDTGVRTNRDGFTWSGTGARTTVSGAQKFSGSHSLAFRFGADTLGQDSSAEQQFVLGRNLPEIWIEYMIYVPSNYQHRVGGQNKFFRLWGNDYNAVNKVGASTYQEDPASKILFDYTNKAWTGGTGPLGSPKTSWGFPAMLGTWTRLRIHARHVSADNADDGILRIWRDAELVMNWTNVPQKYDATRPFWNRGYLLGWSNSGFTQETVIFIDDVKFWSTNPGWLPD